MLFNNYIYLSSLGRAYRIIYIYSWSARRIWAIFNAHLQLLCITCRTSSCNGFDTNWLECSTKIIYILNDKVELDRFWKQALPLMWYQLIFLAYCPRFLPFSLILHYTLSAKVNTEYSLVISTPSFSYLLVVAANKLWFGFIFVLHLTLSLLLPLSTLPLPHCMTFFGSIFPAHFPWAADAVSSVLSLVNDFSQLPQSRKCLPNSWQPWLACVLPIAISDIYCKMQRLWKNPREGEQEGEKGRETERDFHRRVQAIELGVWVPRQVARSQRNKKASIKII